MFNIKPIMKKMIPRKLGIQLAVYVSLLLIISMTGFSWHIISKQVETVTSNMKLQAKVLANNLSAVSGAHLLSNNYSAIEQLLLRAVEFPGVYNIQLSDVTGKLLGDVTHVSGAAPEVKYGQPLITLPKTKDVTITLKEHTMIVWHPVILGELIGWVKVTYSLAPIVAAQEKLIKDLVLKGLIIIFISVSLLLLYMRKSIKTIETYTDFADELNDVKVKEVEVNCTSIELEHLGRSLNNAAENLYEQNLRIMTAMSEMERLVAFPEMNPNIVLSMNLKGEVQYLNPYGEKLINGFDILQSHMSVLLPENIKNIIEKCLNKNETIHAVETTFRERSFLWTFSPVINQKLVHGYALEITQRKNALADARSAQLEKMSAEAANTAKSAFLANMSHEIRTPLTAIIGFSELLLERSQSMEERVESINTVIRSGKHLMQIINDILDLSKVEASKLEIESIDVSPFEILNDVHSLVSLMAENKGLYFDIDYVFPMPKLINTDPVRLKQIVINLCNNAVKFTHQGGVKVKVSYRNTTLSIEIIDTGIGLNQEQQQKIFNPFTQADASTTRQYGGTGLGLHLSKQLAAKLGGDITVNSRPHEGSCFSLTLSIGDSEQTELVYEEPKRINHSVETKLDENDVKVMGKVLVAEDNIDNQRLVSMYLKKLGADVVFAQNGKQAIEIATNETFDLILMDMQMPVMNGVDATRQLRELNYDKPIVALTANAMKEDVDACVTAGCNGFIHKPISKLKFKETILKYLSVAECIDVETIPMLSTILEEEPEMIDLVIRFVDKLPTYIMNITKSSQDNNWDEFKGYIHDLKGTSGNYGFEVLFKLMQDIEFELTKGNYNQVHSMVLTLEKINASIKLGIKD